MDYMCQCVEGYMGKDCETERDECLPNPCLNNGSCIVSGHIHISVRSVINICSI